VFLILFMCPSTLIYLCMLNHICIPRMRPSWSWCMSFSMCVKFRLWVFWWEFLHLCSSTQSSSKFQHHFHRNRKKINPKTHFGNTRCRLSNAILSKKKKINIGGITHNTWFQIILQSYINKNSMVLVQIQTHWSTE
jgi:hypothetical protein